MKHSLKYALHALMILALTCQAGTVMAKAESGAEEKTHLEAMVVTAEKRRENVQDIPVSITALSGDEIQDAGLSDIQGMSRLVPNLYIANWGIRGTSYAFIRGIGSVNNEPALGFYVDDVGYMDARSFDTQLFDIERIEVLRGPQGTLYGRNSLAGVINIITRKPDNETHAGLEYTLGNYNLNRGHAYLRTPLVKDRLFLGLSAGGESRDGYFENSYLGKDVDSRRSLNGRGFLRWLPSDTQDVSLAFNAEQLRDGAFPLAKLKDLDTDSSTVAFDREGTYNRDSTATHLKVSWQLPWFDLTSVSAYRDYEDEASNDQDFTTYPMITSHETIDDKEFSQELRLASRDEANARVKWLAGFYGYKKDKDHLMALDFAPGMYPVPGAVRRLTDSNVTTTGTDLFGQATLRATEHLSLTAGLRYDHEKSEIDHTMDTTSGGTTLMDSSVDASDTQDAWLPKLQLDYRWTPGLMTYVGVSKGYRSGGFNTSHLDPKDLTFDSEFSWNYETGVKSSWFDNQLTVNASLFYIELKDQQVVQLLPSADTVIRNVGESRSMGVEVESSALLAPGLTLDAGFGYTDAEFKDYKDNVSGADYTGNEAMMAPSYTYNLALTYRRPINHTWDAFTRSELNGTGSFYWDTANTIKEEDYELVNLSMGLESERYDIVLWAKNLLDTDYRVVAFEFPGSDPVGQSGDPLTAGVTFRARF